MLLLVVVLTALNIGLITSETIGTQGIWLNKRMKLQSPDFSKQRDVFAGQNGMDLLRYQSLHANLVNTINQDLWISQEKANDVTYQCLNDTEKLLADLLSGEQYATKYLDADGKLPPGFLQGGWSWVGDYQECHSIEAVYNDFTEHAFKGKYFSAALHVNGQPVNGPLSIMVGTCLPDSCDTADTHALAEIAFAPLAGLNISVAYVVADMTPEYDGAAIATFVIIGCIGLLVLLGTFVELVGTFSPNTKRKDAMTSEANFGVKASETTEKTGLLAEDILLEQYIVSKKDKVMRYLMCFSFVRNTKKLINIDTAKGPLSCLNGLRVISMWWVIQGHTYEFSLFAANNALYAQTTLVKRFTFQPIVNGTFSVDTFFFLSGLLVAYLAQKEIREKGKLSWIYFCLHRFWRLTPLYAFVLLVFMSLSVHLLTGPYQWFATDPEHGPLTEATDGCRDYWWTNLLYINNFYPNYGATSGCMGWGWYLANDMQFYIFISPILIILFKYNKTVGAIVSVSLILACIGIRAFLVSWYGIFRLGGQSTKHTEDPWGKDALYVRPWARLSVYVIGFLTGYVLQNIKFRLRLNKFYVFVGWCLATSIALAVIYGMFHYNSHPETKMSLVESGFYVSLCRTAWALSLSWLVLACSSGHGGIVNWILSWNIWAPLGRLTYAAYLVHPIVLILYIFNLVTPVHFTDLTLIFLFVSSLVFSYLAAYIVSMAVEAPMMAIETFILNK